MQEAVSRQLAVWGDLHDAGERARRRAARPVERDLEAVLMDLADQFPLLSALVERRSGGQRKLPMGGSGGPAGRDMAGPLFAPAESAPESEEEVAAPPPETVPGERVAEPIPPEPPAPARAEAQLSAPGGARRPGRYGLSIQFEPRPDDPELGRLVESTVWVNETHPAYRRAAASRSEGYHVALATAMALAPLAVEPAKEHGFVTAFLAAWGAALGRRKGRRRRTA